MSALACGAAMIGKQWPSFLFVVALIVVTLIGLFITLLDGGLVCGPGEHGYVCVREWMGTFATFLIGILAGGVALMQWNENRKSNLIARLPTIERRLRACERILKSYMTLLIAMEYYRDALLSLRQFTYSDIMSPSTTLIGALEDAALDQKRFETYIRDTNQATKESDVSLGIHLKQIIDNSWEVYGYWVVGMPWSFQTMVDELVGVPVTDSHLDRLELGSRAYQRELNELEEALKKGKDYKARLENMSRELNELYESATEARDLRALR